jgi:aminoglycoside phosphotransferase (APT) family kinase protein
MTAEPPGLDLGRLAAYLREQWPELVQRPPTATLIAGGRSNLTYLVACGSVRFVLRRPPLGHVLASAHDVGREYLAISVRAGTPVPDALLH